MGLHTVSPGLKQDQADLLPAARLSGKESSLDQDQPVTQKQGPYCGVLKWVFFPFVNPIPQIQSSTRKPVLYKRPAV